MGRVMNFRERMEFNKLNRNRSVYVKEDFCNSVRANGVKITKAEIDAIFSIKEYSEKIYKIYSIYFYFGHDKADKIYGLMGVYVEFRYRIKQFMWATGATRRETYKIFTNEKHYENIAKIFQDAKKISDREQNLFEIDKIIEYYEKNVSLDSVNIVVSNAGIRLNGVNVNTRTVMDTYETLRRLAVGLGLSGIIIGKQIFCYI